MQRLVIFSTLLPGILICIGCTDAEQTQRSGEVTATQVELELAAPATYGAGNDVDGGPMLIDECIMAVNASFLAVGTVKDVSDVRQPPCEPDALRDGYREVTFTIDRVLAGQASPDADGQIRYVLFGTNAGVASGDVIVGSFRDVGDVIGMTYVFDASQSNTTEFASQHDVDLRLPNDLATLEDNLQTTLADFANECPSLADNRLSDADYHDFVYGSDECQTASPSDDEPHSSPGETTDEDL